MLQRNSHIPLHYQLYDEIKNQILNGQFKEHQPIPTENELQKKYNVSRTTIRKALDSIKEDGYVYKKQGSGTFVAPLKQQHSLGGLTSFTEDMQHRNLTVTSRILDFKVVEAPPKVVEILRLQKAFNFVLYIKRLRLVNNDEPMGIHNAYIKLEKGIEFTKEDLEKYQSLYKLLQEKCNISLTNAGETLEAKKATKEEQTLLKIEKYDPVLYITRTTADDVYDPIEYVEMAYRSDKYKYFVNLKK